MAGPRLLLLVPETSESSSLAHHGSSKDVACLEHYLEMRHVDFTREALPRQTRSLLARLKHIPAARFDVIILSVPGSHPRALLRLRRAAPHALILFRAHNAEFLHRLDWMAGADEFRAKVWLAMRAVRALLGDLVTVWIGSNRVLAISEDDARRYWMRMGRAGRIVVCPYFDTRPAARVGANKSLLCVGLGAVMRNPIIDDATETFFRLVGQLQGRLPGWRFACTGDMDPRAAVPDRVQRLGLLDSPHTLLEGARAVAVLTDLGRGFKTKILDAVMAGCWVLVTRKLYLRLPDPVRPFCRVVDPASVEDFATKLAECGSTLPDGEANEALRTRAFEALDAVLALPTGRSGRVPGLAELKYRDQVKDEATLRKIRQE